MFLFQSSFQLHWSPTTKGVSPLYTLVPSHWQTVAASYSVLVGLMERDGKGVVVCCPSPASVPGRSYVPGSCGGASTVILSLFPVAAKFCLVPLASFIRVSFLSSPSNRRPLMVLTEDCETSTISFLSPKSQYFFFTLPTATWVFTYTLEVTDMLSFP